ncbi:chloride channel protein EriC [Rubidibacter lacunae KORDI 51-2]|uniref:Chloride channel protein EriC n=1 Tax=Rubidibacter lacunae KORDI 51-2 TaxID=582515 RepID=U5DLI9_9CHRO|nr:chloride channel protein [Rubidibacter lacunae]ERN42536.1 chloride channel protein EriC [Rubidibacter lacunae KORDI 51-2]
MSRFLSRARSRALLQSLRLRPGERRYALLEACAIGIVSAVAALALKEGVDLLSTYRIQAAVRFGWIALPLAGAMLGFLAGVIVENLAPQATGGGIPQVKAILAQFPLPMGLGEAVVKAIGTILILGSGMTLGRRGPTVYIGAALAAQLSAWVPTSPVHRRQMIASGAAAGLAAGFNTPIAGVFFVVEELMRDVSGLTLETAILASFTGGVVSQLLGATDGQLPERLMEVGLRASFETRELPFYLLLGVLAGVAGTLFSRGILQALEFNRRLRRSLPWRIALAGLVSGGFIALLPNLFHNQADLREFIIFGQGDWQITAIAFFAYFLLTILAYGSGAPGGLFAPALVLGAALGYLVGTAEVALTGQGASFTYVLAGMSAFFTAVVRVPVTAIVIVLELTADFNAVLPLMISAGIAYVVGESVRGASLYQYLLAAQGIDLDDDASANTLLDNLDASDIMHSPVETLSSALVLEDVRHIFARSRYRGFPVVTDNKLVGVVTQADITRLASRPGTMALEQLMTARPISVQPSASLSEVMTLFNRYQLSHLPVARERELLGIITRSDIIRAEVGRRSSQLPPTETGFRGSEPSYLVYQTRSPALGDGRLLLPLANPNTAPFLMRMAAAIARMRRAELECLRVVPVPRHQNLARTRVTTEQARTLMHMAEAIGLEWDVPVHSEIRLAHDVAHTVLNSIRDRHISLVLGGWQGTEPSSSPLAAIVRHASCDVVLVKPGDTATATVARPSRWLIPIAGGPNTQRALELLPELSGWTPEPEFWLCQVFPPDASDLDSSPLDAAARELQQFAPNRVTAIPIRAHSVTEAIVKLATTEACDVTLLGDSRESFLQRALHGNLPAAIAREIDSTVILVRAASDRSA